ncbi:MAG: inorganic phosphate transporter [Planctomycetota bacterium]|jgi:PiT family inorganic phosphate transporter
MAFFIIGITALLGLYMAWNIGANDVANSMADAVGSRAITIKRAIIAAGLCEFAGAVLVGSHVTDTVRKGIVDPNAICSVAGMAEGEAAAIFAIGMGSALLAAALWLNFATRVAMPVSTTHSIVGGVAGFGIVAGGWTVVNWAKMGQIVASWFISPIVGGILAYTLFRLINHYILRRDKPVRAAVIGVPVIVFIVTTVVSLATFYKGLKHILAGAEWFSGGIAILSALSLALIASLVSLVLVRRYLGGKDDLPVGRQLNLVEHVFAPVVIITSCSVAFAHGANDVANSVGPLAAVAHIVQEGCVVMKVEVPFWILALGGAGIVLGLATYGYRVMTTVGTKITQLTPSRGVAADIAATATVLMCTRLKLPVSTTHTLVGAIFGVGLARGLAAVNRNVTRNIFTSWLITVPAAAVITIILFLIGRVIFLEPLKEVICDAAARAGQP